MPRKNNPNYPDKYRDIDLPTKRQAKARGIVGYRMVTPPGRSDVKIRVAITQKKGPRGGRTVATSKLKKIR